MLVPMLIVANWLFALLPGSPSAQSLGGRFAWFVLIMFPAPLECLFEICRREGYERPARRMVAAFTALAYLALVFLLASVSAGA